MTTIILDDFDDDKTLYKLFLLDQETKPTNLENCDQIINTYERLMLEEDLFPENNVRRRAIVFKLCGLPEAYWERSLPLIKKAIQTFDIHQHLYSFLNMVNTFAQEGNLEGIKLFFPPNTTQEQLTSWYENETINSAPYALFEKPNLLGGQPYIMSETKNKYACLEYLLQLSPEKNWQTMGCHKENNPNNRWKPLISKAAAMGDNEMILWLVDRGHPVNVHEVSPYDSKHLYNFSMNINPITCAIANHNTQTAHILLQLGCNSHSPPCELRGALDMAIGWGAAWNNDSSSEALRTHSEELHTLLQPLIDTGSDIKGKLLLAAEVNNFKAIQLLINAGGNIEETNDLGETPLMVSFNKSNLESFTLLYLTSVELYDTGRSTIDPASIVEQLNNYNRAAPSIAAWLESYHLDKNTANSQSKSTNRKLRL